MPLNVNDIYLDVEDRINQPENGQLSYSRFNRYSWLAQLKFIDWLSGNLDGVTPPEPYLSQKNKDFLAPFITKFPVSVVSGKITKPSDYYAYENMYLLGNYTDESECDGEETDSATKCNTVVTLLDGTGYNKRCETFIEGLQPSFLKPIAKLVGNEFEFNPSDIGSITLEYIRYPRKAVLNTKEDTVFKDLVYDPETSVDFEWPEFARNTLVWFIADYFYNFTREQAGKQFNAATGKQVVGG